MKKFTENEIGTPHYAGDNHLRNKIYELVDTLTPSIEGIDETKITMIGKEDLVEELVKIAENSSIDASIDLFNEFKSKMVEVKNEKVDPLMEAFNQVNKNTEEEMINEKAKTEEERAMSHFKISEKDWKELSDEDKKEKISNLPERKGKNKDKE